MSSEKRLYVCSPKGTPPGVPGTPAAYANCCKCGLDLVYDARNKKRIKALRLKFYCRDCAADVVLHAGTTVSADVRGMDNGGESTKGVQEFVEHVIDTARRRPN